MCVPCQDTEILVDIGVSIVEGELNSCLLYVLTINN